jgi:hypothetical protein
MTNTLAYFVPESMTKFYNILIRSNLFILVRGWTIRCHICLLIGQSLTLNYLSLSLPPLSHLSSHISHLFLFCIFTYTLSLSLSAPSVSLCQSYVLSLSLSLSVSSVFLSRTYKQTLSLTSVCILSDTRWLSFFFLSLSVYLTFFSLSIFFLSLVFFLSCTVYTVCLSLFSLS